ncbi:MAG: NfeD family protein [Methanoregula sp.]|jgi:membrane-bound ClpP family serine protease|nr:NfeD family protein [Methanoregula sp.]
MVLPEIGISFGWLLIIGGALLLLVEVYSPGFFATVPATVMIILGVLQLMGVDISNPWMGGIIGIITAICAAGLTVWMYGKITTDESPTTISRDSLAGKVGQVRIEVDGTTISGKVVIDSMEWSAKSTGAAIPAGKKVKVVSSEGVHIIVEEVI